MPFVPSENHYRSRKMMSLLLQYAIKAMSFVKAVGWLNFSITSFTDNTLLLFSFLIQAG